VHLEGTFDLEFMELLANRHDLEVPKSAY
jgi:hypothetical protein